MSNRGDDELFLSLVIGLVIENLTVFIMISLGITGIIYFVL